MSHNNTFETVSSVINPSISIRFFDYTRDKLDDNHQGIVKKVMIYNKEFDIVLGNS